MNRRGFLGAIGAALAGATLDPERLLWVPGAKCISIPNADRRYSGLMGLTYCTINLNVGNYLGIPRAAYPGAYAIASQLAAEDIQPEPAGVLWRRMRDNATKIPTGRPRRVMVSL